MDISKALIKRIRAGYALDYKNGVHGINHWARVRNNGLRLAEITGANPVVVELFAVFHDSKRLNDGIDPEHGKRAAEFIHTLRGSLIQLPTADYERLIYAVEHHTNGLTEADVTVQTCWDADRLDLWRCQIKPEASYLCTPAAKDPKMIMWGIHHSTQPPRGVYWLNW
jgi:uncharacterized protein